MCCRAFSFRDALQTLQLTECRKSLEWLNVQQYFKIDFFSLRPTQSPQSKLGDWRKRKLLFSLHLLYRDWLSVVESSWTGLDLSDWDEAANSSDLLIVRLESKNWCDAEATNKRILYLVSSLPVPALFCIWTFLFPITATNLRRLEIVLNDTIEARDWPSAYCKFRPGSAIIKLLADSQIEFCIDERTDGRTDEGAHEKLTGITDTADSSSAHNDRQPTMGLG